MDEPTRILLVTSDDRPPRGWHDVLAADGAVVVEVADSMVRAVARTTASSFDAVLVHHTAVEVEGVPALARFVEALAQVPVVLVADCESNGLVRAALGAGVADVVHDVADRDEVVRVVGGVVERSRLRHEVAVLRRHHRALVELGRATLERPPLPELLTAAAAHVRAAVEARLALVLRRRGDGRWTVQASSGVQVDLVGEEVPPSLLGGIDDADCEARISREPCVQDLPADVPGDLRDVRNSLLLPLCGSVWTGAIVVLDLALDGPDAELHDFGTAVMSLLSEALHRSAAEFDLAERVKELTALADVGQLLQGGGDGVVLGEVARALVAGMQFPDRAVVVAEIDDDVVVSDGGCAVLTEALSAPIAASGTGRGHLTVGYRGEYGFLPGFEQRFVDAAAESLSLWLEVRDQLGRARERESRLQSVLEQVPGIVWVADRDLVIQGHAGRGHEVIPLEPDERAGRRLDEVLGVDHPASESVRRALAGESGAYESEIAGRWFETRVEPLRSPDAAIVGAIAVAVDVTEARQAQAELDASRRRLEGLFTSAHDGFLLCDDAGRLVDANPAAAELSGYGVDELRGMLITDLAPADVGGDDIPQLLAELRATGRSEGVWPMQRPDGEVSVAEFRVVADVVPSVHLVVLTDVTARDRAMAALRDSEARFRRLADNAQDVIYRLDVTGTPRFDYISRAVEPLVGLTAEDIQRDPATVMRMLSREDAERVLRCVTGAREAPAPFVAEVRRPDGRVLWVEERHGYVFDDQGRHVATEGLVRDITARKQLEEDLRRGMEQEHEAAEELRELNAMKDVFLQAVSHELRTPLTSLKGMAHLLIERQGQLDEDTTHTLLDRMVCNADRLEGLLDDLLDIDRLARGADLLQLEEVDMADVVNRTLAQITENGHPITTRLEPTRAVLDRAKIERVVENLVVNALRHTDPGVRVWVHVEDAGDELLLKVEDAGPGIPDHERERVLEPFAMGSTPAAQVRGLGIGLSLVHKFTALHGGTVTVGDRPGGGAAFHVRLPKEPAS